MDVSSKRTLKMLAGLVDDILRGDAEKGRKLRG